MGSPEDLEEEASQQGAFNEETGEINWDCPCLGGMAHGPCGPEFREAFSCFVYSKEEPKGMDCIEKFKGMQDCFREHPDVYGAELDEDDDDDDELDQAVDAENEREGGAPLAVREGDVDGAKVAAVSDDDKPVTAALEAERTAKRDSDSMHKRTAARADTKSAVIKEDPVSKKSVVDDEEGAAVGKAEDEDLVPKSAHDAR
jgi:intermembrane space import and assembly protein 40